MATASGLLVTAALVVACGNTSDGNQARTIDAFLADYCDAFVDCCAPVALTYDRGQCIDGLRRRELIGTTYDQAQADGCLSALKAERALGAFCFAGPLPTTAAKCSQAMRGAPIGTGEPGNSCASTNDCAASPEGTVYCVGVCGLAISAGEGEACETNAWAGLPGGAKGRTVVCDLTNDLYCHEDSKVCTRRKAVGEACTDHGLDCVEGASCGAELKCVGRAAPRQGDWFRQMCQ